MNTNLKLCEMKEKLHVSYSQINCYLTCPLKYRFQYVEGRIPECVGSGLVFGKAIHEAAAAFYHSILEDNEPVPESVSSQIFAEMIQKSLDESPVSFKKGEDQASILSKGTELISLLYKRERPNKVVLVEHPITTNLIHPETGEASDIALFGIIDLVEEDEEENKVLVDLKTGANRYDDLKVSTDMQMTIYSHLAIKEGLVTDENVLLRFDLLLKQKTPSLENYFTVRSQRDRNRMLKTIFQVLSAVEQGIFYPTPGWMCSDCGFKQNHCQEW